MSENPSNIPQDNAVPWCAGNNPKSLYSCDAHVQGTYCLKQGVHFVVYFDDGFSILSGYFCSDHNGLFVLPPEPVKLPHVPKFHISKPKVPLEYGFSWEKYQPPKEEYHIHYVKEPAPTPYKYEYDLLDEYCPSNWHLSSNGYLKKPKPSKYPVYGTFPEDGTWKDANWKSTAEKLYEDLKKELQELKPISTTGSMGMYWDAIT